VEEAVKRMHDEMCHSLNVENVVMPDMYETIFNLTLGEIASKRAAGVRFLCHYSAFTDEFLHQCQHLSANDASPHVRVAASHALIEYYLRTKDTGYLRFIINNVIKEKTQPQKVRVTTYLTLVGPRKFLEHRRDVGGGDIYSLGVDALDIDFLTC
jgi:hypothetical protein